MHVFLIFLVLTIVSGFAFWTGKSIAFRFSIKSRRKIGFIFILILLASILGMGAYGYGTSLPLIIYAKSSMFILGFFTYLSCFLLITAPIVYFKTEHKKNTAIFSIIAALVTMLYGYIHERDHKLYEIEVPIVKLEKPLNILQYTDIHLGMFQGKKIMHYLVETANRIKPDMVLITGDLIDGVIGLDKNYIAQLKKISAPTYFISGNHDDYIDSPALEAILMQNGVTVLNNEIIDVGDIKLVGLEFMSPDEDSFHNTPDIQTKGTIKSVIQALKPEHNKPLIFAIHNPVGINYLCDAGADLILAGHTHAGQFFPFNLVVKTALEYSKGLYSEGNCHLYVSQGVGAWGPPIRVSTDSEITLLHLIPQKLTK